MAHTHKSIQTFKECARRGGVQWGVLRGEIQSSARILSVTTASSQGVGSITTVPITLERDHKCVSGLPPHLSQRDRQLSKPRYQPKEDSTLCTSFPCYPRGAPFPANHLGLVSTQNVGPGQTHQQRDLLSSVGKPCRGPYPPLGRNLYRYDEKLTAEMF